MSLSSDAVGDRTDHSSVHSSVLFLPRLPPLWAVPRISTDVRTGLSDRLRMGSIGRLIEDDSLALRLVFDEERLRWLAGICARSR